LGSGTCGPSEYAITGNSVQLSVAVAKPSETVGEFATSWIEPA